MRIQLIAKTPPTPTHHLTLADQPLGDISSDWSRLLADGVHAGDMPDFPIPPPKRFAGQFDPIRFMESAATAAGTYSFAVNPNRLMTALAAQVAFAGTGTKQENVAQIVLSRRGIRIATYADKTGSFIEDRVETLGEIDNILREEDRVAFYVGVGW